jgi:hypothetical protein
MKRDLFLALLSMDSYNRSDGQHLTDLKDLFGTAIGTATIDKTLLALPGSAASGF